MTADPPNLRTHYTTVLEALLALPEDQRAHEIAQRLTREAPNP